MSVFSSNWSPVNRKPYQFSSLKFSAQQSHNVYFHEDRKCRTCKKCENRTSKLHKVSYLVNSTIKVIQENYIKKYSISSYKKIASKMILLAIIFQSLQRCQTFTLRMLLTIINCRTIQHIPSPVVAKQAKIPTRKNEI